MQGWHICLYGSCDSWLQRCDSVYSIIEVGANSEAATNQKGNYKASQGIP